MHAKVSNTRPPSRAVPMKIPSSAALLLSMSLVQFGGCHDHSQDPPIRATTVSGKTTYELASFSVTVPETWVTVTKINRTRGPLSEQRIEFETPDRGHFTLRSYGGQRGSLNKWAAEMKSPTSTVKGTTIDALPATEVVDRQAGSRIVIVGWDDRVLVLHAHGIEGNSALDSAVRSVRIHRETKAVPQ